ncbi:hypothetical protein SLS55_001466 [Diplodia seriata]|uniref:RNase H type-1 domain-containing protein n=1 Tax=Diplodia seriata TaxID=420778 RepID=A0ABR3CPC0_9PEZI
MEPNSAQQTPARQVEEQTGRDTSPPEEHRSRQARRAAERAAEKAVQKLDKKAAATDEDDDDNDDDINLAPQEFPGEIYIREASAAIRDAQLAGQANPPQEDDAAHSTTISFFADGSRDSARNGKGAACAVVWRDPAAAAAAAATADDDNNNNNNWRVDAKALPDGANSHDAEAHACLRALQLAVATTRRPSSSSSSSASPATVRLIQIFTDSATVLQALIKLRSRRLARWTARRPYFVEQLEAIYNWAALLKDEGVRVVFRWVIKGHAWPFRVVGHARVDEAARAALPSRRPGWVAPEPEWWMRRMERERERKKRERKRREEWAEEEARLEKGAPPKRRKLGR